MLTDAKVKALEIAGGVSSTSLGSFLSSFRNCVDKETEDTCVDEGLLEYNPHPNHDYDEIEVTPAGIAALAEWREAHGTD